MCGCWGVFFNNRNSAYVIAGRFNSIADDDGNSVMLKGGKMFCLDRYSLFYK